MLCLPLYTGPATMPEVMSFYELYHVAIASIWVRSRLINQYPKSNAEAMPLLVPDEKLMTKWLPAVRWGSLEFDQSDRNGLAACLVRLDQAYSLRPWMNQSTLQSTWEGGAMTWIGASDYYRFPHVQHFHSVASLMAKLHELPLTAASFGMRSASQKIRSQTLAAYGRVLQHVLGFGATGHTSDSSFSFVEQTVVSCHFCDMIRNNSWTIFLSASCHGLEDELMRFEAVDFIWRGITRPLESDAIGRYLQEWLHYPSRLRPGAVEKTWESVP